MIVDGRAIAADILGRAKARAARLPHPPLVVALSGSDTSATRSYLSLKQKRASDAGCVFETRPLGSPTEDADAVIVQLPLLGGLDAKPVLDAIPLKKDADILSSAARMLFAHGAEGALLSPVVGAIREILASGNVDLKGKRAVVIGEGFLVGAPAAAWLTRQGAQVTTVTLESGDLSALRDADIIVSGAGAPHLIKPEFIKEGVVLIDAGTSESNGEIVGDADPACADKCALFTPVPGGVGPIAVAKLFENAVSLAERSLE